MSIQLQGNSDSVFSNDIVAPNLPTQGQIVGYQQGVWAPQNLGGALDNSNETWSRIGNLVSINGILTGQNSGGSGAINLEGMPYPAVLNQTVGSCMSQKLSNPPDSVYISASTSPQLRFYQSSTDAWRQLTFGDFVESGSSIYYFASYLTDDTTWTPINGATVS